MFISVICDFGSENSQRLVTSLFYQYGLVERQKNVFEINVISERQVAALKLDIDRVTDAYDHIRIIQYPVESSLVISVLNEKKWRKKVIRDKTGSGVTGGKNAG